VRATGTGFVIGVGRGGAVLSPILAGFLLDGGSTLPTVGLIMGSGSMIAAILLIFLKMNTDKPAEASNVEAKEKDEGMEPSMA
jgi:hypothetical protein